MNWQQHVQPDATRVPFRGHLTASATGRALLALGLLALACARAEEVKAAAQYYTVELLVFAQDEQSALVELQQGRAALPQPDPNLKNSVDLFRDTRSTEFSYLKKLPAELLNSPLRYIDGEWNSRTSGNPRDKPGMKLNQAFFSSIYQQRDATSPAGNPDHLPAPREFVPLPESYKSLLAVALSISRQPGLRLLAHLAWNQRADPFGKPRSVRIHNQVRIQPPRRRTAPPPWLGFSTPAPAPKPVSLLQLDGVASLSEGTFLHVQLDLVYRQPLPGGGPRAQVVDGQPLPYLSHHLRVRRRLTANTRNYLDSRHLGAIVVVRKWPPVTAP